MAERVAVFAERVRTLDPACPLAEAVLVEGTRVVAVGRRDEIAAALRPGDRRWELPGATVLPGLTDAHVHLLGLGLVMQQLDLRDAAGIAELQRRVAEAARREPRDRWILGRGWDQERFAERRWPNRHDLDRAAPGVPVLLRRVCGHAAVASTAALEAAGVGPSTPDPPGGRIGREPDGRPDGLLFESAVELVERAAPPPDDAALRAALAAAIRRAHAAGLTGVHTQDVWSAGEFDGVRRAYAALRNEGLPIRVYALVADAALPELLEDGLRTGSGDDLFRVGPAKIFADGSLGAATAAVSQPYVDPPGVRGLLASQPEELAERVLRAHRAGFQLAVHAIGDRAADAVLDAFERAAREAPRADPRHRLIHCQVMRPEQWRRMRDLGVIADIQPVFVGSDWRLAERRLRPEQVRHSYAWRSLLAAGVRACGGSDAPVEPIEPMRGIHCAITRRDPRGEPPGGWQPQEALAPADALALFTTGAAYAAFAEGREGVIAPGAWADLVAFAADPLAAPPDLLLELAPVLTMVAGQVVHAR